MPGSGEDGWLYVDLDNQPGCVRIAYEDSENFYSNRKISKDATEVRTFSTQRYKRTATDNDAIVNKQYDDDNDDDDDGDDDDHHGDSKEDKQLRKSCNMDDDGNFSINGQKFVS